MLHLYALTQHPAQLLEDSVLEVFEVDGIDAVAGETAGNARDADEAAILEHARIVEELAALNEAVLPARLGLPYASVDALADAVRGRETELKRALERVRGCTEMGVRVVCGAEETPASPSSGGEYMRRRLAAIRSAERIGEELNDAVHAIVRDGTSRVLASSQFVLSAAYLVPHSEVDSFRTAVDMLEHKRPELTFVCTGPWPPYSFALVGGHTSEQR